MATNCVFCGCFNGKSRAMSGYEPDPEDFERSRRAFELLSVISDDYFKGGVPLTGDGYDEIRALLAECYVR